MALEGIDTHIFLLQSKHAIHAAKLAAAMQYGGYGCETPLRKLLIVSAILKTLWRWKCEESCITDEEACTLVAYGNKLL